MSKGFLKFCKLIPNVIHYRSDHCLQSGSYSEPPNGVTRNSTDEFFFSETPFLQKSYLKRFVLKRISSFCIFDEGRTFTFAKGK